MFRNKAVLKFLGKHAWQRPLVSRCTDCSLERYWKKTSSKIYSSDLFEITHNFCPTRGTTATSCPLSYHAYWTVIPRQYSNVLLNAIICDVCQCRHTLMNQYISIYTFTILYVILFSGRQLLPSPKHFKCQTRT